MKCTDKGIYVVFNYVRTKLQWTSTIKIKIWRIKNKIKWYIEDKHDFFSERSSYILPIFDHANRL